MSFPLIGLVQLANYWLMLQVLQMQPSEVLSLFKNTTGHSQGIVAAAGMSLRLFSLILEATSVSVLVTWKYADKTMPKQFTFVVPCLDAVKDGA